MASGPTSIDRQQLSELFAQKRYAEALDCIGALELSSDSSISRAELADIFFVSSQCLYRLGNYRKAVIKLKCSIKIANPLNDNLLYARQKYTLGQIYRQMGRIDDALAEYTESYAFFKRVGDVNRMFAALEVIAVVHFEKGNLQQATNQSEDILRRARVHHVAESYRMTAFNLCRILLWTGDFARIRELLESVADECTDPLNQTWLESLWGTYYVRLLDHDRARKHLANAVTIARKNGYRRDEVVCLEYLGLNEFYAGDYAKAKEYYEQILSLPEITASAVAQTKRLLTDTLVALDELDRAALVASEAEIAITNIKEWVELGCLHRAWALLADRRGDAEGVAEHFDKAMEILDRHGARYEVAATYLAMGRARSLAADVRKERLQQARALFKELGVPMQVERAQESFVAIDTTRDESRPCVRRPKVTEIPSVITLDPKMQGILAEISFIKDTNMTVLITGETGTGKDLLAKYVHCVSRRARHPFVLQNATTLTESLIEGQLFGCRRGAFTGALEDRPGLIESAHQGTFALNEIGEMSLALQAKLLDVLETGMVTRVGDNRARAVDVRFAVMTNKNLEKMLASGTFREDLYYRVHQVHFHLPPLRERKSDVPLLLQYFLESEGFGELSVDQSNLLTCEARLLDYHWPGNVRELRSVLKRACAFAPTRRIIELVAALKIQMSQLRSNEGAGMRRLHLQSVVKRNNGNLAAASRELGIPESTLRRQLRSSACE
jgi:transcriptional regulator with PAS, ATPase and Fis domain